MKVRDKLRANELDGHACKNALELYEGGGFVIVRQATKDEYKARDFEGIGCFGALMDDKMFFKEISIDDEISDDDRVFFLTIEAWEKMKNGIWMGQYREENK